MQEVRKTIQLSIVVHGGPWGGCEVYHELEQELKALLWEPEPQWLEITEKWLRHLAVELG